MPFLDRDSLSKSLLHLFSLYVRVLFANLVAPFANLVILFANLVLLFASIFGRPECAISSHHTSAKISRWFLHRKSSQSLQYSVPNEEKTIWHFDINFQVTEIIERYTIGFSQFSDVKLGSPWKAVRLGSPQPQTCPPCTPSPRDMGRWVSQAPESCWDSQLEKADPLVKNTVKADPSFICADLPFFNFRNTNFVLNKLHIQRYCSELFMSVTGADF